MARSGEGPTNPRNIVDEVLERAVGVPLLQSDEALNDSDKSFTVTAAKQWAIQSIRAELTTTGTGGNRQMLVEIQDDSGDVVSQYIAGAVQAASITRFYHFSSSAADLESFRDTNWLSTPLPLLLLPPAYVIRVYDNNAVDAAADDLVVQLLLIQRESFSE